MPIKLGSTPVNPQGIESVYWGNYLVYLASRLLTATGVSPLNLVNSVAKKIKSLTQYGKCTQPPGIWNTAITQEGKCIQNGTPTPDAPVDIVCNNGALRYGALGSNLYDPSTAVFEVGYYYNPNANGAQTAAANNFIYHAYIPIEAGEAYVFYGRKQSDNRLSQYNRIHWYAADKTYIGTNAYTAGTISKDVAPDNAVYARLSCNPQGVSTAITEGTVLGYNWTFCKGTEEVTPFEPFVGGVKPVGTPEVLTVRGKNLFDPTKVLFGYYRDFSMGNKRTSSANFMSSDDGYIPCLPNTAYTFVGTNKTNGTYSKYNRIYFFDSAKKYLGASSYQISQPTTGTTPSNCYYLQIRSNPLDTLSVTIQEAFSQFNWQLEQGSTATNYEPYVTPQTATDIPMLLGVGDYADEAELISGLKTGKVGIKVFDGTENWIAYTSSTLVVQNATSDWGAVAGVGGYCTHLTVLKAGETTFAGACRFATAFNLYEYKTAFDVADVAGFKAKLASEYANGTPVILVYPLATETTEQTTAYPQLCNKLYAEADVTAEVDDISVVFTQGTQTTPNPYSHLPIMCNNGELKWNGSAVVADSTPEVLTVSGQNLVDLTAVTDDYYYDSSGVYTAFSNARLTDYIHVKSGQKYTVYVKAQRAGVAANVRCSLFDTAKTWKLQSVFSVNSGSEDVGVISPTEDGFLRVSANYGGTGAKADWSTLQIVRGEYTLATMPPYQPYATPQTVTDIPMLLGVGDYKDEAELIQGIKTGKVGVKVFDGTETFTVSSSGAMITTIPGVAIGAQNVPMNTHFALETSPTSIAVGAQRFGANGATIYSTNYYVKHPTITTAADFKAWLASEYANGTPVIVIYPLATATTEQDTSHDLSSYKGETIISVESAVDPVELSAEYYGK